MDASSPRIDPLTGSFASADDERRFLVELSALRPVLAWGWGLTFVAAFGLAGVDIVTNGASPFHTLMPRVVGVGVPVAALLAARNRPLPVLHRVHMAGLGVALLCTAWLAQWSPGFRAAVPMWCGFLLFGLGLWRTIGVAGILASAAVLLVGSVAPWAATLLRDCSGTGVAATAASAGAWPPPAMATAASLKTACVCTWPSPSPPAT